MQGFIQAMFLADFAYAFLVLVMFTTQTLTDSVGALELPQFVENSKKQWCLCQMENYFSL